MQIKSPTMLAKAIFKMVSLFVNLLYFQKPSRYINNEINAIYKNAPVRVALAFPDIYEIGMSHLGLKILYKIINDLPYASAERVFSPWIDVEAYLKANNIPLCSLETNSPLRDFDIVGFSLQYELSYTTVLNMLSLGRIPTHSEERISLSTKQRLPLIIAGGPCTVNPLPMSPYIDVLVIGDGEEVIQEILNTFYNWKKDGDMKRESLLYCLSDIQGLYIPYIHDNRLPKAKESQNNGVIIKRRYIRSLDAVPYPDNPVIPYTPIVHDRINVEVARGCSMGCRFCQAGIIYRPVRERSPKRVLEIAKKSLKNTGYEEISFTSLSAGDYSCLLQLLRDFNKDFSEKRVAISLPSLRVASINRPLLKEIRSVRKTGFTIAPEAGTDRLRRVINKDFKEEDYEYALKLLFEEGWLNLKLYFMIGLPTENHEDIEAIFNMAMKALKIAKKYTKRFVNINVGISPFVPKAHTPFQWYGQTPTNDLKHKKDFITNALIKKGFKIKGHNIEMSLLEAALSRGDKSVSPLIEKAWALGCRLDAWKDIFNFDIWKTAMDITGVNASDIAQRNFKYTDSLPWEFVDTGITKKFLWNEYQNALKASFTVDCRKSCHNCGLDCSKKAEKRCNGDEEIIALSSIQTSNVSVHRFNPVRIRVEFSKTSKMRYLSHLELVLLIQRAIRRVKFPLNYTQGYHPCPKISFGPPLGVGIAGIKEYFDIEVFPPFDLKMNIKRLNYTLPEGISIKDMVYIPSNTLSLNNFITRYLYEIKGIDPLDIDRFISKKEIIIKRETCSFNIKDLIEDVHIIDNNTVNIICLDKGKLKVRLGEVIQSLSSVPIECLEITRLALFGWDNGWVKPISKHELFTTVEKI